MSRVFPFLGLGQAPVPVTICGDSGYYPYSNAEGSTPKGAYVELLPQAFALFPAWRLLGFGFLYRWKDQLSFIPVSSNEVGIIKRASGRIEAYANDEIVMALTVTARDEDPFLEDFRSEMSAILKAMAASGEAARIGCDKPPWIFCARGLEGGRRPVLFRSRKKRNPGRSRPPRKVQGGVRRPKVGRRAPGLKPGSRPFP